MRKAFKLCVIVVVSVIILVFAARQYMFCDPLPICRWRCSKEILCYNSGSAAASAKDVIKTDVTSAWGDISVPKPCTVTVLQADGVNHYFRRLTYAAAKQLEGLSQVLNIKVIGADSESSEPSLPPVHETLTDEDIADYVWLYKMVNSEPLDS